MSYRTQISEALKAQLIGKTEAGSRVFTSLDRPLNPKTDFPAVIIYAQASRRSSQDYGNTLIPRTVSVGIEAAISADPLNAMAAAEALADAIELAIEADPTLGLLVENTKWLQTLTDTTSVGETTLGVVLLEYSVDMLTNPRTESLFTDDDGFTAPPTKVFSHTEPTIADHQDPLVIPDVADCGEDGCDLPAWGGER